MPLIAFLIEFLIPICLIGTAVFFWKQNRKKYRMDSYDMTLEDMRQNWRGFVMDAPQELLHTLHKITDSLEAICRKAEMENWLHTPLSPDLYAIHDITYKHFPSLVFEYQKVPSHIKNLQGKNASDFLHENGAVLLKAFEEHAEKIFESSLRTMTVQQHYFKEKFKDNMDA